MRAKILETFAKKKKFVELLASGQNKYALTKILKRDIAARFYW